jgi:FtsZ-interacting cell division protein ZipA
MAIETLKEKMEQEGLISPKMANQKSEDLAVSLLWQARSESRAKKRKKSRRDERSSRQKQENSSGGYSNMEGGETEPQNYYHTKEVFSGGPPSMELMNLENHYQGQESERQYYAMQGMEQQPQYYYQAHGVEQQSGYQYQPQGMDPQSQYYNQAQTRTQPMYQQPPYHYQAQETVQLPSPEESAQSTEQPNEQSEQVTEAAEPRKYPWTKLNDDLLTYMVSMGKRGRVD